MIAPTLVPRNIDGRWPSRSGSGPSTDSAPTSYAPRAPPGQHQPDPLWFRHRLREVDEAHDFKVFTMGRLRADYAPERARLGKELAQEISQELHDHGYSHLPEPLPTRQEQHVYIYGDQSPMAELIHYIGSEPDELGGAFLRFVAKALAKGAETLH